MKENELQEIVTKEYLGEFTETVIFPGVEEIVNKSHNKIIDILDKQGKILEDLKSENASHVASYKRHNDEIKKMDSRLSRVERKLKIQSILKKTRTAFH